MIFAGFPNPVGWAPDRVTSFVGDAVGYKLVGDNSTYLSERFIALQGQELNAYINSESLLLSLNRCAEAIAECTSATAVASRRCASNSANRVRRCPTASSALSTSCSSRKGWVVISCVRSTRSEEETCT